MSQLLCSAQRWLPFSVAWFTAYRYSLDDPLQSSLGAQRCVNRKPCSFSLPLSEHKISPLVRKTNRPFWRMSLWALCLWWPPAIG